MKITKTNLAKNYKVSVNTIVNYEKIQNGIIEFLDLATFIQEEKISRIKIAELKFFLKRERQEKAENKDLLIFSLMKFGKELEEIFLATYDCYCNGITKDELENFWILNKKK